MPRSSGSQVMASMAQPIIEAPHVFDDGVDLLVGEQVAEARHAAGALALGAVLLAELGAAT